MTTKEELKEKGDDGVKYNGCQKELEVAREIAREQSSFRGRKGKLKRIAGFEEEQMNALLKKRGFSREETIMNTNLEIREIRKAEEKDDDDEERKEQEENTKKKRRKNFEEKKKGEAYEGKPSETTENFSWWRNAGFSWGGLVGSKRELDRDVDINEDNHKENNNNNNNGFTEDKQEDIFNQAHQMASAKGSRRGLGDKAKLGKEFTGTKRSFDEDEEKEDEKKKKRKEEKKMKKKKERSEKKEKKKEKSKSKTRDEDKVEKKKSSSKKKKSKKTK